jgi:hypothetical protein
MHFPSGFASAGRVVHNTVVLCIFVCWLLLILERSGLLLPEKKLSIFFSQKFTERQTETPYNEVKGVGYHL